MIDLSLTKSHMMAEIDGSVAVLGNPLPDGGPAGSRSLIDPFVSRDNVCFHARGCTPGELLPMLTAAFTARFEGIQPEQLHRDLLDPVKKGIGNAYKWGNHCDPSKLILVEVAATRRGAVVSITDEGGGFDVERVLMAYRHQENYFTHGGSGIDHFDKAKSFISYADGGRTVLIGFSCGDSSTGAVADAGSDPSTVIDANAIKQAIIKHLPYFKAGRATLESCQVYLSDDWGTPGSDARCSLQYQPSGSPAAERLVVTARLLPAPQAARDFVTARTLFEGPFRGSASIRIPKPLMVLDPLPLVLYEFGPSHDFREHLKTLNTTEDLTGAMRDVADALRTLHGSAIPATEETLDDAIARGLSGQPMAMARLAAFNPAFAQRAERAFRRLMDRATSINRVDAVPIHGAFETNAIVHEAGQLFLYRFETCRRSHPGFDVGTFLSELLRFYLRKKNERRNYPIARDAFLKHYFGGVSCPWRDDVPIFTAYALQQRLHALLQRPQDKWEPKVEALLEQCDEALSEGAWL